MRFLAVALLGMVITASIQGIPIMEDVVEVNIIISDGAVSFVSDKNGIITEDDVLIHCQGLDEDNDASWALTLKEYRHFYEQYGEFACSIYGVEIWGAEG